MIQNVGKRRAILILLGLSFLLISCDFSEALEFTPGQEGQCPPLTSACCPQGMEECTVEEMLEGARCQMKDHEDYDSKIGYCLHGKVCHPAGIATYACREQCEDMQVACLDAQNNRTCTNILLDSYNCGGCAYDGSGRVCEEGTTCKQGTCSVACLWPQISCGGQCISPGNDKNNCGGCVLEGNGTVCQTNLFCSEGRCQADCSVNELACGENCIDPNTDVHNCGGCVASGQGVACETGYQCLDAECKPVCAQSCQNGGTCTAPNTCTCSAAWSGARCIEPVCSSACQNGGTCTAPGKCTCVSGWIGAQCQTAICKEACQNGGTCTAPNTCSCTSAWTGATCGTPVCNPACQNGTCTAPGKCTCVSGWSGAQCQTAICNEACQNGGTCTAPNTCTCPAAWSGKNCEVAINRVRIPATGSTSTFTMGRPSSDTWVASGSDGNSYSDINELPPHQVTLSAYEIDRYLVTASDYRLCVEAGKCSAPNTNTYGTYGVSGKEKHPINCVSWQQAIEYCAWAGGRLPTEAEWERAAKGPSHRRFPWGDDCPASWNAACTGAAWTSATAKANCGDSYCHDAFPDTSPVGSFEAGKSPDGLYDMAGILWEWTNDWFALYAAGSATNPTGPSSGTQRALRGGAFRYNGGVGLRTTIRFRTNPESGVCDIGFRCAKSL